MIELEITGLKGEFEVFLFDSNKKLKAYRHVKNLTVNVGFTAVCEQMGSTIQPAVFNYCGIGDGTIEASTIDTELGNQLGGRQEAIYTQVSIKVWSNEATFLPGISTGAITESGLFNASESGTMLCRQTFPVINKTESDTLVITWQYTLSS